MAIFRKKKSARSRGADTKVTDEHGLPGFSPNPITNLILTDIALRGVSRLARRMTEQKMLSKRYSKEAARSAIAGRTLTETLIATAAARAATRSVPGAILIGGGLLAKTLYDRRRGRMARVEGQKALHKRMTQNKD